MVYRTLSRSIPTLYPACCLLCGAAGHDDMDICRDCRQALPVIERGCRCCAIPLPPGSGEVCGQCQWRPPAYQQALVPFHYRDPVDHLIRQLKFAGKLIHARLLAMLLGHAIVDGNIDLPQCLIPVPLHPKRIRQRGFNQALELARHLGRALQVPVVYRSIRRIRHTNPQMGLPARARKANVKQAFEVGGLGRWQRVAIVDDVITTGSTVDELARMLTRAGVDEVQVWGCARVS